MTDSTPGAAHATHERLQLGELAVHRLRASGHEALVAEQGAQVLTYGPIAGGHPIVFCSERAEYRVGQSVRGGVPVCWPWFGDLRRNPRAVQDAFASDGPAPAHGFARALPFRPVASTTDATTATLRFALGPEDGFPDAYPHHVSLEVEITLGPALRIRLTSRNDGPHPITLSQALHSYLAVSDIRAVEVLGLEGSRCIDTLDDWRERPQHGPIRFAGETDQIHLDVTRPIVIADPAWGRSIELEAEGSRSCVVWNPWIDKSRRLGQFAPDAWTSMLCVETARVLDDVMVLAPGEAQSLGLAMRSQLSTDR